MTFLSTGKATYRPAVTLPLSFGKRETPNSSCSADRIDSSYSGLACFTGVFHIRIFVKSCIYPIINRLEGS
jgi:hypothetical protein